MVGEAAWAGCPDANVLVGLVEGSLDPHTRDMVEAHLDQCEVCAGLVGEAVAGADAPTLFRGDGERRTAPALGTESGAPVGSLPRGSVVGRFIVLAEIGAGGLGRVYAAYDPELDRRVAVKLLKGQQEAAAHRRLLREAQAMAKLSHPNVVPIHDFGVANGQGFIAMELIEGTTLRKWAREPGLGYREIRDAFEKAGAGLAAAHRVGLVHRDFKPSNVLVDASGRVMVTDFGLARGPGSGAHATPDQLERPHDDLFATAITDSGMVLGTVGYMAPEQLTGRETDHRADQFAFCVSLYEALYGVRPFRVSSTDEYLSDIRSGSVGQATIDRGVPAWMRRVVLKGLRPAPEQRYASMDALLAALCADRTKRRRSWILAAALGFAGATALAAAALIYRPTVSAQEVSEIDALVLDARAAASRAYFLYPPAGEPEFVTAYRAVLDLEALEGAAREPGKERAASLRGEFADTLTRLGDEYWERPGGVPFAADYYAAALVFDPTAEAALERMLLTPGELAALRSKAAEGSFTEAEISAAEPLAALADTDPKRRQTRLAKLTADAKLPSSTGAKLEALSSARRPAPKPKRTPPPPAVDEPIPTPPPTEPEPNSTKAAEATPSKAEAKRRATEEVKDGRAAIRANDMAKAKRHFHRALRYRPELASALAGLCEAHFEAREYAKAVEFGKRAVGRAPRRAHYRILLGDAYRRSLRYDAARQQYAKAKELGDPAGQRRLESLGKLLGE